MLPIIVVLFVVITRHNGDLAFLNYVPISLLITAQAAGVRDVNAATLVRMRLRKIRQDRVVLPLIAASKAGVAVSVYQLESHYLAGGNVERVVLALIASRRAGIPLTFERRQRWTYRARILSKL